MTDRSGKPCLLQGDGAYRFLNEYQCYIIDIFVQPQHRKTYVATDMADIIAETAKQNGYKELIGTVVPSTKNSTASLKVLLGYGMLLHSADKNLIVMKKEI